MSDLSRDQRRSRRKRSVRGRTINPKRISKFALALESAKIDIDPPTDIKRPRTRGDCATGVRPCPWVTCVYHLFLDVAPDTQSIKLNFPDLEAGDDAPRLDEMQATCALDVADNGGSSLERTADLMNLTRERIRQIESIALSQIQGALRRLPIFGGNGDAD